MNFVERMIDAGDVRLATRDWGGDGPAAVLLHGLGPDQRSLEALARRLAPSFRVVTYDQRGAGRSSVGPWTLEASTGDLGAVIEEYGLSDPLVVGHSLGGMIALAYSASRPVRAAVNIDGWGPGRPEQYLGEDPARVREFQDGTLRLEPSAPLARVALRIAGALPAARRSRSARQDALAVVATLDVLELHRRAGAPVLAFNCTAPVSPTMRLLVGREGSRLMQSYRRGLKVDLETLVRDHPNVTVVELDAGHMVIKTEPELVARPVLERWAGG